MKARTAPPVSAARSRAAGETRVWVTNTPLIGAPGARSETGPSDLSASTSGRSTVPSWHTTATGRANAALEVHISRTQSSATSRPWQAKPITVSNLSTVSARRPAGVGGCTTSEEKYRARTSGARPESGPGPPWTR